LPFENECDVGVSIERALGEHATSFYVVRSSEEFRWRLSTWWV